MIKKNWHVFLLGMIFLAVILMLWPSGGDEPEPAPAVTVDEVEEVAPEPEPEPEPEEETED